MKPYLILLMAIFLFGCGNNKKKPNPKAWTEEFEQDLYNYFDEEAREMIPNDAERKEYNDFFIQRLKEEIPEGWNSVSKDSLKSLNIRINREYTLKRKAEGKLDLTARRVYNAWSPFIEKSFRENYQAVFEKFTKPSINTFCDCMIGKLKIVYPDSILIPVPNDIMNKATLDCKHTLIEK